MFSSAKDIKKQSRKAVTLPSGLQVEIRRLQLWNFIGTGEIPVPPASADTEPEKTDISRKDIEDIRRYSMNAIVKGTIRPRFTMDWEEAQSDEFCHPDDLAEEDFNALVQAILEWSGLGRETAEAANSFRDDGLGKDGPDDSGKILPSSNGGTES